MRVSILVLIASLMLVVGGWLAALPSWHDLAQPGTIAALLSGGVILAWLGNWGRCIVLRRVEGAFPESRSQNRASPVFGRRPQFFVSTRVCAALLRNLVRNAGETGKAATTRVGSRYDVNNEKLP
jgi:hypothetical protein